MVAAVGLVRPAVAAEGAAEAAAEVDAEEAADRGELQRGELIGSS